MKARTRQSYSNVEPTWDEDFELELEGSQSLRILCYRKTESGATLIGRSALEVKVMAVDLKNQMGHLKSGYFKLINLISLVWISVL